MFEDFNDDKKIDDDHKIKVEEEIDILQQEVNNLKQEIEKLSNLRRNDAEEYTKKLEAYEIELNNFRNELKLSESQRIEQTESLTKRLEDCKAEINALKKELIALETQKQKEVNEIRESIKDTKQELLNGKELDRILIKYGNNPEGMSVLHYAIKCGDIRAVQLLIENGADLNSVDSKFSALTRAVSCNQLEIAKFLLDRGADVNFTPNGNFSNALYYAAKDGSVDMFRLLVEKKVNINQNFGINKNYPDNDDPTNRTTALHVAAENGKYEIIVALLKLGAEVNGQLKKDGQLYCETPLDRAAKKLIYNDNPKNLDLIKSLVQEGGRRKNFTYDCIPCPIIKAYLQSVSR